MECKACGESYREDRALRMVKRLAEKRGLDVNKRCARCAVVGMNAAVTLRIQLGLCGYCGGPPEENGCPACRLAQGPRSGVDTVE